MRKYRIAQYGNKYFPQIEIEIDLTFPIFGKPKKGKEFAFCNLFGRYPIMDGDPIIHFDSLEQARKAIDNFPDVIPEPILHKV